MYKDAEEDTPPSTSGDDNGHDFTENKYKEMIFGEDALKIPPSESYCLSRPIRRGHFNVSQNYSLHQVGNRINACLFFFKYSSAVVCYYASLGMYLITQPV